MITDLESIDRKIKAADTELRQLVTNRGSTLTEFHRIGPSSARRGCWPMSVTSTVSSDLHG
jgi:hypothetical protein